MLVGRLAGATPKPKQVKNDSTKATMAANSPNSEIYDPVKGPHLRGPLHFQEVPMTKKTDKPKPEPLFVLGVDLDGKPRGGRFDNIDDRVVSVALDLGLAAVVKGSAEFAQVAQKLPAGRLY